MFFVRGLTPHTQYVFSVRKIGFVAGTTKLATPQAGDTLWIDVMLQMATPQLATVSVTARANPAYNIDATEIAKYPTVNALDVVLKFRPLMLGDAYKECRPDTSHLGPPIPPPMPPSLLPPMGGMARPKQGNRAVDMNNGRVFLDTSLAMHGYPPPPRLANPADTLGKLPPNLYINGILHGELGMKNILADIPVEDIAEMHYVDCLDTTVPSSMRNALFIVLKPGKAY